jgi:hypothetical protein
LWPPQTVGGEHEPHMSVPPQPSETGPQLRASAGHVVGLQTFEHVASQASTTDSTASVLPSGIGTAGDSEQNTRDAG